MWLSDAKSADLQQTAPPEPDARSGIDRRRRGRFGLDCGGNLDAHPRAVALHSDGSGGCASGVRCTGTQSVSRRQTFAARLAEHGFQHTLRLQAAAVEGIEGRAVAEDDHAGGKAQEFLDFGGEIDHRPALFGIGAQMPVKLGLGADIDAAGRIVEDDHVGAHGKAASDQHLLLVPAGERRDAVFLDAELDQQVLRLALEQRRKRAPIDEAQNAAALLLAIKWHDHVFEDGERGEDALALAVAET